MTIPDEAVQAAQATYMTFGIDDEMMREALTAAAPFLQGVKVKDLEWGNARITEDGREAEDAESPIGRYIATDTGWFLVGRTGYEVERGLYAAKAAAQADFEARILSAIEFAPSPRAQALEDEIVKHANKTVTLGGQNYKAILLEDVLSVVRALSQPVADGVDSIEVTPSSGCVFADMGVERPVADGWLPIESAPKDGTVIQVWHQVHKCPVSVLWKDDGFPYRGERLNWYERSYTTAWPESAFTHWRPLPASPEVSG